MKDATRFLVLLAGWLVLFPAMQAADHSFGFAVVCQRAKMLAAKTYEPRPPRVPAALSKLTYDQQRRIRFRPEQSWWRRDGLPFQLQFFHPGFILNRTVQISEVVAGRVQPIKFDRAFFNYDDLEVGVGDMPASMGFAGFRILCELNKPNDELGAFQGASYFRLLCEKAVYGLSARGLALDTAEPGGEEFPVFEEFWIERPVAGAKQLVAYALLDSPSVAGAYRFILTPGADSVAEVKATVYCRRNPKVFGIAPLTSMFWYGENSLGAGQGDFRPEVHDSDGLMLQTGTGEWIWRPLTNPKSPGVATFSDVNPRGFGLIQRDRKFDSYEDLEAQYHRRPSAWVEPVGDWGRGTVRLVELPTPDETNDNIVAFWVPAQLPPPGTPVEFEYKLHWFLEQIQPPAGRVVATRLGYSRTHETDLCRFIVDFDGAKLQREEAGAAIEPVVNVGPGAALVHTTLQKNPFNGTWRVAFALRPDGSGRPVELRCFLHKAPHVLTETWSYLWNP